MDPVTEIIEVLGARLGSPRDLRTKLDVNRRLAKFRRFLTRGRVPSSEVREAFAVVGEAIAEVLVADDEAAEESDDDSSRQE